MAFPDARQIPGTSGYDRPVVDGRSGRSTGVGDLGGIAPVVRRARGIFAYLPASGRRSRGHRISVAGPPVSTVRLVVVGPGGAVAQRTRRTGQRSDRAGGSGSAVGRPSPGR